MNTVTAECPNCGAQIAWFSGKGELQGETYPVIDVPFEIAFDIAGNWTLCAKCHNRFQALLPWGCGNVKMRTGSR